MEKEIVNKIANSGIVTIDLEDLIPDMTHSALDIKDQLFQGLMLREKDFRQFIKDNDWAAYQHQRVAVYCSADAIVPTWAYMLLAKALDPVSAETYFCQPASLDELVAERYVGGINPADYQDTRVVIKGCGNRVISNHAYVALSTKLFPVVKSLMFGEPCSTVPVYKRKA